MSRIHLGNNPLRAVWRSGRVFRKDWAGDWTTQSQSSLPVVDRHHWLVCWRPDVNFTLLKIVCCCRWFLSFLVLDWKFSASWLSFQSCGVSPKVFLFLPLGGAVDFTGPQVETGRKGDFDNRKLGQDSVLLLLLVGRKFTAGALVLMLVLQVWAPPAGGHVVFIGFERFRHFHCDASQPPSMPPDKNNFLTFFFFSSSCRCVPVPKPFHTPHNFFKAAWNRFHLGCFSSVIKF